MASGDCHPERSEKSLKRQSLGAAFAVLAMLAYASMDTITKWLVVGYPIGQMMWIRYGIYCLFTWLMVRRRGFAATVRSQRPWLQTISALLIVVESVVFVLALSYLPLADTHAIAAASPLIVIVLGMLFLHERAGPSRWLAVVAGFIGMLLIVRPGFRTFDWPLLLPVLGALMWGGYQILIRLCTRTDSADTTLVWSSFVPLAATTLVGPIGWQWPDATAWALMVAAALCGAFASYALIRALDYAEASAVQPYSYTLLVWVTILGALVFGHFPGAWTLIGAAIIVASGLYTWHHDRRLLR